MFSDTINKDLDSFKVATSTICTVEQSILHLGDHSTGLNIVSLNIRSIYKNFVGLEILLLRLKIEVHIIILSECWLNESKAIPILEGYNSHLTKNCKIQNDGVIFYVLDSLDYSIEEPILEGGNYLILKLKHETALIGIYRSPSYHDTENFLNAIEQIVLSLKSFTNIALIGDINLDIRNNTLDHKVANYLNLTAELGLLPAHTLPTRENNCLDHVLIKTTATTYITVLQTQITDHSPVIISFKKSTCNRIKPPRQRTKTDWQAVLSQLKQINFDEIFNSHDINKITDNFISLITHTIKKNTNQFTIQKKYRMNNPWMTPGLLKCIVNKDRLHQEHKSDPLNLTKKIIFNRYSKFCADVITKVKNLYNQTKIESCLHSSKLTWKAIKDISNVSKTKNIPTELLKIEQTPQDSIETTNIYFATIGQELCKKVCPPSSPDVLDSSVFTTLKSTLNSIVILPADESEIEKIILGLKSDSATGWDNISSKFLKMSKDILVRPLTRLINLCIDYGIFPTAFKKAIIHPIHKSGDKHSLNNYRPISILTSLSKVFEKLLNSRLLSYLNTNSLLSNQQFGFRAGISTEDAVLNLCNTVSDAMDKKQKCIAIFLDLAKAFDTVSIPTLIVKMERLGIRGTCLRLFSDFLSNRSQRVKVGDLISAEAPVTYGVPQGSILGPSLFLIYINDLCQLPLYNANIFTYADDTALIFRAGTWEQVFSSAEQGLKKVIQWLNLNLLTLNVSKTKFIPFALRSNSTPPTSYKIIAHYCTNQPGQSCECQTVDKTSEMKYLGVMLDERMTWVPHIKLVTSRTRKLIWMFKKLRHVANPKLLKTVYLALCQSILTYCLTAWGGAYKIHMLSVERAQRSVLKTINFKPYRYPTADLYNICQVLTVRQLYILNCTLRMHANLSVNQLAAARARRNSKISKRKICRTEFMHHQFQFLSSFLYDKLNKTLNIYLLNKHKCKQKVTTWLLSCTYDDTEALLKVIR